MNVDVGMLTVQNKNKDEYFLLFKREKYVK